MSNFQHPQKGSAGVVTIASTDDDTSVEAQFNPKELQVDKTVPWTKKSQANQANANQAGIQLEFTGAEGRSMTLELLFDGFEKNESVSKSVDDLNWMASVLDPEASDESQRRPHLCVVTWGSMFPSNKKFKCVIESLSVKYTMFSDAGVPLRATCTVKLKEADSVAAAKPSGGK